MADAPIQDLFALDREVSRAVAALERWRARLRASPDDAEEIDPLEGLRRVASNATRSALLALPVGQADAPLRDALAAWVAALVDARVGGPEDLARAKAMRAAEVRVEGEGDEPRTVRYADAWRELVSAPTPDEGRRWLSAMGDAAWPIAEPQRDRAAKRLEVARRLGFAHPWEIAGRRLPEGHAGVRSRAATWLDASEDLARATRKETAGPQVDPAAVIHAAVGRGAGEGWPARLTPRWFEDAFGAASRFGPVPPGALPRTLGASSFARALVAFGRAAYAASAPRAMPFALARSPWPIDEHRLGYVFGALAADPDFHVRALGLGRRVALRQTRVLASTLLLESRVQAARTLLLDEADFARADAFDELTVRAFGRALPGGLCGAWPLLRRDEPERLVALLEARPVAESLRDRFDVDWYRNPRAWDAIRAREELAAPTEATEAPKVVLAIAGATATAVSAGAGAGATAMSAGATAASPHGLPAAFDPSRLVRAFEEALG